MLQSAKCLVPGCRYHLRGMTGFQEVRNLQKHYEKSHLTHLNTTQALELRERMEHAHEAATAK